jgi:hypothetical protein
LPLIPALEVVMAGRRRTPRFMLDTPVEATLCIHHPVVVDSLAGEEMWITSDFPAARNDLYAFSRVGSNPASNFRLRVEECEPIVMNGAVRHRVRLTSALDHGPMASAVVGVLTRTLHVRIVQVSDGGCLLESPCRLDAGASADLRVQVEGETWADHVRVRHCSRTVAPDGAHLTGAEFVWSRPVQHACLRSVLGKRKPEEQPVAPEGLRKLGSVH